MSKISIFTSCLREIHETLFLKIMSQMCFIKNKSAEANEFCVNMC